MKTSGTSLSSPGRRSGGTSPPARAGVLFQERPPLGGGLHGQRDLRDERYPEEFLPHLGGLGAVCGEVRPAFCLAGGVRGRRPGGGLRFLRDERRCEHHDPRRPGYRDGDRPGGGEVHLPGQGDGTVPPDGVDREHLQAPAARPQDGGGRHPPEDSGVKRLVVGGESFAPPESRRYLEEVWGCPVYNSYGSTEGDDVRRVHPPGGAPCPPRIWFTSTSTIPG